MIYITINTKGGVGKTTTAVQLASVLHNQNQKFKIIELDDDVNSMLFENSDFLTSENSLNVTLSQKGEVVGDVLFDAMSDPSINYILDVGAGNNVHQIIESLVSLPLPKTFLIPATSDKKYLENAKKTYELINDPQNTIFVLNRYVKYSEIKEQFIYFFGDKKLGITPVSPIFKTAKWIALPASNYYQIAEDENQSLLDLANISILKNRDDARREFYEISNADRALFHILWSKYEKSIEAAKVFFEVEQNMKALFE